MLMSLLDVEPSSSTLMSVALLSVCTTKLRTTTLDPVVVYVSDGSW